MSTGSSEKHLDQNGLASPSEDQFKKLVEVISPSQQNYRELIDNLDQAVFTLSLQGEIRVANRRMSEVLGVPFQELIGHRLSEFIESPTVAEAQRSLSLFVEKGCWTGRIPVRLKGAREPRYFECSLQAVAENDHVGCVIGWARNVTVQHETEIRFAELFECLGEGILLNTPEGQVLDANPALIRMLGCESKEQFKALNFREFYANPAQRETAVRKLVENGSIRDVEVVLRRKDGKRIHCLASGVAIRDASGRVTRMQGTFVDITERIEIERRLHREQEFVRRLVASFPDIISVLDHEGRITFVSKRVQDVMGSPPPEYVGETLGEHAHPEDSPRLREVLQRLLGGQIPNARIEYRARHADGSWRTLRASASPLFDEAGKIGGVVVSARDVTESKRLEQQLTESEKFAAMGQMMAGAAHELNNPLTAILGVSDLLREHATDEAMRRQADLVLQQARRAAGIVQNLLAFVRPLAQRRSRIHLNDIVQEALRVQQASLRQKNIAVNLEAPGNLPPIEGDPKLLTQVFLHIIANAEQSISAISDHGTLKISLAQAGDRVSATFADDGPGILPENLDKIFHPFFTTKRPGGGAGLGLTISLAVVKEHGGMIEVQSTPGAGAAFRVLLPAIAEELTTVARPDQGAETTRGASEVLRGHSVLIVDDEESIREIVQESLSARGMKVEAAEGLESALSQLAADSFDIVLCDFNLQGQNGKQFYDRLRARPGNRMPHFIFMTGDLVDSATVAELGERSAHILQKPFHISALAELLAAVLRPQPAKQ
jgi:two-component system NtrC family sensor kinase